MKNEIRNAFSAFLMFSITGIISFAFNTVLGGNIPIVHSLVCGVFIVIVYTLFTFLLIQTKSELKMPAKVFLSAVFAFCVFTGMGYCTAIFAKNIPIFWWMYVTWILFAVFAFSGNTIVSSLFTNATLTSEQMFGII